MIPANSTSEIELFRETPVICKTHPAVSGIVFEEEHANSKGNGLGDCRWHSTE